ncbi:MAG: AraC family transcriptional regulator [Fimbriimonadaceae bacterium]
MGVRRTTVLIKGEISRPSAGVTWTPDAETRGMPLTMAPAWQSRGGPAGHPANARPSSLEIALPESAGRLLRVQVVGVFAEWFRESDSGRVGASIQLRDDTDCQFCQRLIGGCHYSDAFDQREVSLVLGDGTSIETIGKCDIGGRQARVDLLTIDVPPGISANRLRFLDLGSPSSFGVFDAIFEYQQEPGCPFKASSGGVSLAELASVIRVGDRLKLNRALAQLEAAVSQAQDIDEARGEALTFLAVVCAATIEMGGSREMHRVQLDSARDLERLQTGAEFAGYVRSRVEQIVSHVLGVAANPTSRLVDRALEIVDRNFAKDLSDERVAAEVGLSTSHFRHLFRQATGQPFHKYLVALRLEKARQLLTDQEISVSGAASAVGFAGLSHFSRAFSQRFSISPSELRRSAHQPR